MERNAPRCGFVLAEAIAALVVLTLLGAVLLVVAGESRRQAGVGGSLANLRQFADATAAYAADNDDQYFTFSWRAGVDYGFGGVASTDLQAAANQAVDIMRRRGEPMLQPITGWIPHVFYSPLVLTDYLDLDLPQRWWASPADAQLISWQEDPSTLPPGMHLFHRRFQSSYELGPAFYAPDARQNNVPTISQSTTHNMFNGGDPSTRLGGRRLGEVQFPGQKVQMYDRLQRHFGPRTPFFMYDEARIPLLMADGSAGVRRTGDSNLGFNPETPTSLLASRIIYQPDQFEPPTMNGQSFEYVAGHYRWTRSGLRGRDFGGPEVPWVE